MRLFTVFIILASFSLNSSARTCSEKEINRELNHFESANDEQKLLLLNRAGCDVPELEDRVSKARAEKIEKAKLLEEQREAQKKAEKEERDRKSAAEFAASIEESNAEREAFNQEMADKCGEYPLELKIGMSEKLLKIGCAGQADIVGEEKHARVYRMYGVLVSVFKGKVVRWIRE